MTVPFIIHVFLATGAALAEQLIVPGLFCKSVIIALFSSTVIFSDSFKQFLLSENIYLARVSEPFDRCCLYHWLRHIDTFRYLLSPTLGT